jgi:molybdopterin/thiamine biosynthesis adenylyltransferase
VTGAATFSGDTFSGDTFSGETFSGETFSGEEVERYARHLVLRELGGPGQQRLKSARVLLVGAGGLGCVAAPLLAAAGVGAVGLVDPDVVSLSNLQRQTLYRTADVGRLKVDCARERLAEVNPHVQVAAHPIRFTPETGDEILAGYDLVLDGTDDFATRFAVNAAAFSAGVALVSGAIERWTGQVGVFAAGLTRDGPPGQRQACYRCLIPDIPPDSETCARVGVVGALAGVIGAMMALEAVKLIADAGEPLVGRLLIYDALSAETRTVRVPADPACPVCGGGVRRAAVPDASL